MCADAGTLTGDLLEASLVCCSHHLPASTCWLAAEHMIACSFILIEICDTLRSPRENVVLKKASIISIGVTSFYYMCALAALSRCTLRPSKVADSRSGLLAACCAG